MGAKIMTGSISADAYSDPIYPGKHNNGFHLSYSSGGTLACTLYLQCRDHELDTWKPVSTASFPTYPAGSAINDEVGFVDAQAYQYRIFADYTSGTGDLTFWVEQT